MKLRKRQFVAIALVVLALGLGGWMWVRHLQAKRAVAKYKQHLVLAGEKLTIDELRPPLIPADKNNAGTFLKAADLMQIDALLETNSPSAMSMTSPGRAMVGSKQASIRSHDATNTWQELEAVLARNREALRLLKLITEKPALDFDVDYDKGWMVPLKHLLSLKHSAKLLSSATVADLHYGETASAVANVRAILALTKGIENERTAISQLVRIAMTSIALNASWELLQSRLTDEELMALQSDWTGLDFIQAAEATLCMERAASDTTLEQCRRKATSVRDMMVTMTELMDDDAEKDRSEARRGTKKVRRALALKLHQDVWRFWWSYPDQLQALRVGQVLIETARKAQSDGFFREALRQQTNRLEELNVNPLPFNRYELSALFSRSMRSFDKYLGRAVKIEAARRITVTAIALKRYQLRNGSYPDNLSALVPGFLPAVPRDPVDGEPLRYQPEGKASFLLYSVGEDTKDDGGDPRAANPSPESQAWHAGRDWVWPHPASAEEVEASFRTLTQRRFVAAVEAAKTPDTNNPTTSTPE